MKAVMIYSEEETAKVVPLAGSPHPDRDIVCSNCEYPIKDFEFDFEKWKFCPMCGRKLIYVISSKGEL